VNTRTISVTVNETPQDHEVSVSTSLRDFLRDDLDLIGAKAACQDGMCGNCTVLVDQRSVKSCLVLAAETHGAEVTTIEGLGDRTALHPLQRAFAENFAAQCGFCTAGMILTSVELLERNPSPTLEEVREGLVGNICRCTAYVSIAEAVLQAAAEMRGETAGAADANQSAGGER
jgi:aerobic-type carbon monoxide dehydrogenase small subunit (CoxS/CutS family)